MFDRDAALALATASAEHLIEGEAMVFGHIGHFLPECRTLSAPQVNEVPAGY